VLSEGQPTFWYRLQWCELLSSTPVVWLQYSGSCIHIANFATVYNLHECHLNFVYCFPLHFRMIRCSAWSCSSGCQESTWLKTLCIEWAKPVATPPGPPERFCATATTWRQVSRACPNGHVYSRTACINDLSRATTVQCLISSATQRRGLDYLNSTRLFKMHIGEL
jgi:hypothetical protein